MALAKQINQASFTINIKNELSVTIPAGQANLIPCGDSFGAAIFTNMVPPDTMGTIALDGYWNFPADTSIEFKTGNTAYFDGEQIGAFGFPIGIIGEETGAAADNVNVIVKNCTSCGSSVTFEATTEEVGNIYILGNIPFVVEVSNGSIGAGAAYRSNKAIPVKVSNITANAGTECCTESGGGAVVAKASGKTIVGYYQKAVESTDTVAFVYLAEKTAVVPS